MKNKEYKTFADRFEGFFKYAKVPMKPDNISFHQYLSEIGVYELTEEEDATPTYDDYGFVEWLFPDGSTLTKEHFEDIIRTKFLYNLITNDEWSEHFENVMYNLYTI